MMGTRWVCGALLAMTAALFGGAALAGPADEQLVTVYKDANCGCCVKWMEHLSAHGLAVRGVDLDAAALAERKRELGIPPRMQSCHTGVTAAGLVFEGHVPATSMARFLADHPPTARGLAVPGMPPGSPGMEMGDHFVSYTVWELAADGETSFEEIERPEQQYAPGRRP